MPGKYGAGSRKKSINRRPLSRRTINKRLSLGNGTESGTKAEYFITKGGEKICREETEQVRWETDQ